MTFKIFLSDKIQNRILNMRYEGVYGYLRRYEGTLTALALEH